MYLISCLATWHSATFPCNTPLEDVSSKISPRSLLLDGSNIRRDICVHANCPFPQLPKRVLRSKQKRATLLIRDSLVIFRKRNRCYREFGHLWLSRDRGNVVYSHDSASMTFCKILPSCLSVRCTIIINTLILWYYAHAHARNNLAFENRSIAFQSRAYVSRWHICTIYNMCTRYVWLCIITKCDTVI